MASKHCSLLTLSILFLSLQPYFLYIKSDDALINNLCSQTEAPHVCKACLNNDPSSKAADVRGLSLISLHCNENAALVLSNYTDDLATSTSDSDLKPKLVACSTQTLQGYSNLQRAYVAIQQNLPEWRTYSVDQINGATPLLNGCKDVYNRNGLALPQQLLENTLAVNQDIAIASAILRRA